MDNLLSTELTEVNLARTLNYVVNELKQIKSMLGGEEKRRKLSQHEAHNAYGRGWVESKLRDAKDAHVKIYIRTGEYTNSPIRFMADELEAIWNWEKSVGLPYPFQQNPLGIGQPAIDAADVVGSRKTRQHKTKNQAI